MVRMIATCCGLGRLPFMPGTWASLFSLIVYYFIHGYHLGFHIVVLLTIIAGFLVSGEAERQIGSKDAKEIVIDEFSAQLLVFAFLPFSVGTVVIGFILFRALDIYKPLFIRKIQDMRGSPGIMLDDIVAALIVNIILRIYVGMV